MNIKSQKSGGSLIVYIEGRIDSNTAGSFEEYLHNGMENADELVLDFEKVEYISSAGLRVLLFAQKNMSRKSGMYLKNVNKEIMEEFELTCFTDILTIK